MILECRTPMGKLTNVFSLEDFWVLTNPIPRTPVPEPPQGREEETVTVTDPLS